VFGGFVIVDIDKQNELQSFALSGAYHLCKNWNLMTGLTYRSQSLFGVLVGFMFVTDRIAASLSLSSVLGLVSQSASSTYGGRFSLSYRFHCSSNKFDFLSH
jgi:hypothetical protein